MDSEKCALEWVSIPRDSEYPNIHSILWGNSLDIVQVTNFLSSYRWEDFVKIGF